jgi:hypothetical protein
LRIAKQTRKVGVMPMNYRAYLIDRKRIAMASPADAEVLDYMALRNLDSVAAWRKRMRDRESRVTANVQRCARQPHQ